MKQTVEKRKTGDLGEDLVCQFLAKHGYCVIERNYLKKFGEIDIICKKNGLLHFVEVKTVSRETFVESKNDTYMPENNLHASKLKRIGRTIEVYLNEKHATEDWKFHVVIVVLRPATKEAKIKMLEDLIL